MKKFNKILFLAVAMVGFSALAMDDSNIPDAANRQLIKDAQTAAQEDINLYELIGVSESATQEQIEKARRARLKQNHPDKGGDQEAFKALNNATEILKYVPAREKYDTIRKANASTAQAAREAQERAQQAAQAQAEQAEQDQKEKAEREARFQAEQAEWRAKAAEAQAKWDQKRKAEQDAQEEQVRAYRTELRSMNMAQAAKKFNLYAVLGIRPNQCGKFEVLQQHVMNARSENDPRYTPKTVEQLKRDEEIEYAYDTLRFESTRNAYNDALQAKEKRARKSGDVEDATDRPTSRRRQSEASTSSSFLGSLAGMLFGSK